MVEGYSNPEQTKSNVAIHECKCIKTTLVFQNYFNHWIWRVCYLLTKTTDNTRFLKQVAGSDKDKLYILHYLH